MQTALLVIGCLLVMGCGYRGDGSLAVHGNWPFRTYELVLPEVALEPATHRFAVAGLPYIGSGPRVSLVVSVDHPFACTRLSTEVTVLLLRGDGKVLLKKMGSLNMLAQRVREEGRNQWPGALEWMPGSWKYADESISRRAVPLEPGVDSLPEEVCRYWSLETVPSRELAVVEIVIGNGPARGTLQISLSEGWK